ncbi:hypothetical protein Bca4012_058699 [Brassica carinata]
MKKMFDRAADLGVESIVIEMSHRGRLNIARWWCESASLSKRLIREESSFTCVACNESNEFRYRVILSVSDNTGTAAFLAFDMEVAKLTYVLASEAAQIVGIGVNAQVDTFQLKLNEVTSNHQNFTISRIFPTRELAPIPAFIGGVQVPEAVAPGLDARVVNAGKVAEQASTSDGSHPELSAPAKERFAEDEKALKKARLE